MTEVDLWRIDLDAPGGFDAAVADSVLSADERRRAAAFRFEVDRRRWIAGRAALRSVLGAALGRPAGAIEFGYGSHGKPNVPGSGVRFNLAHSGSIALLALGATDLGVDVEQPAAPGAARYDQAVARAYFSEREVAHLDALDADERPAAFLRCWTRKEAYVKAKGGGLSLELSSFSVSLRPGEDARLVQSLLDAPADRWAVLDVSRLAAPCTAALVVRAATVTTRERVHRPGTASLARERPSEHTSQWRGP